MKNELQNMWKLNNEGIHSLLDMFSMFKEKMFIKWTLEDYNKTVLKRIFKDFEKMELIDVFRYNLINTIVKEKNIEDLFYMIFENLKKYFLEHIKEDYDLSTYQFSILFKAFQEEF